MKEVDGTIHALQERDLPDGSISSFGALFDPLLGLVGTTAVHPEQAPEPGSAGQRAGP